MMRLPPELDPAEACNLMRRARHPFMAMRVLLDGLVIVLRSLMFRLLPAWIWYPRQVRRAIGELNALRFSAPASTSPVMSISGGPTQLKLAIGHLVFDRQPDWYCRFSDGEQYVSLHRWNWLLRAITDEVERPDMSWGVGLMRSYLQAMSALPDGLASESYTVGERISNSLIYARVTGGDWRGLPTDVQTALATMAHHLAWHLEYHGNHATGNHPLNNARALYLAGQCLGLPAFRRLALLVLIERLSVVQTPSGFMREGSSHYHLLFTRWLLELQFAAREFEDAEALALLDRPVREALACSWFFLVPAPDGGYMLPTIGDVSPDCEPTWLLDLVLSAPALAVCQPAWLPKPGKVSGWARLWSIPVKTAGMFAVANSLRDPGRDGFLSFPDSGWHRLQWREWTALWRTEPGGSPPEASHAHQDLCSLVLYRHGREVLIDIGRSDYERSSFSGMYAVTHGAHNSLSLNGLGPMLTKRDRFLPAVYRRGVVQITTCEDGESFRLTLTHEGFRRLGFRGVKHTRHFVFGPSGVEIEDVLQGRGRREIALHFQWASRVLNTSTVQQQPGAGEKLTKFCIETQTCGVEGCCIDFVEAGADGMAGWRYPAYGVRQPCMTQTVRGVACLPSIVRHVISIQSEAL
ncbi:MAG: heparinase II/III-family protein [Gammaproteobacteria bacterium]|nr:heparinase II/III-family protein [Gammaproteobacteria bacterium]MBU0788314.1 heparinase II/III-family protein [Gammaproteobacteria bacterium]MBU0815189.1 heparinase II/III-family protein [Gammaproteobacteria bacterium]MBU1785703.1 heparinase II/III-family protein [Gammaproteobacteria bacterium]